MEIQNFKNHKKNRLGFFVIILIASFILFIWSIINLVSIFNVNSLFNCFFTLLFNISLYLAKGFANRNQDRIIRMEMRYRYHLLTGRRFETLENQLTIKQIVALRFASDEEIVDLIKEAISKKLSQNEIKSKIKNWIGDYQRV